MAYRMVKLDFKEVWPQTSEIASYVDVKFESRNPFLYTY
jgi:hypothetical protein